MLKFLFSFFLIPLFSFANEAQVKKTYLEDIFIWRISDELNLSAQDEKKFTEIQKNLNKKKAEINNQIQQITHEMSEKAVVAPKLIESRLKKYRLLLSQYNQISIDEFDQIKKLLGVKKFSDYLHIKSELTTKLKSMLVGNKANKAEAPAEVLPPPKVIIEKPLQTN